MRKNVLALTGVFVLLVSAQLGAQTLKGSRSTMRKQNSVAHDQDYTFLRTTSDVWDFVDKGLLVPFKTTSTMRLANVSFPYARPAVKLFAQRLSSQYKDACGERLVVTSLTRPLSKQPWNASDLSVHPAGMAIDLRIPERRGCRNWLQTTLISLEKKGVLDVTRERFPAHFHIAVFPDSYQRYVAANGEPAKLASNIETKKATTSSKATSTKASGEKTPMKIAKAPEPTYASMVPLPKPAANPTPSTHKVKSGESLWTISRKYGVSVVAIKRANDLRSSKIRPGQKLAIPVARGSEAD